MLSRISAIFASILNLPSRAPSPNGVQERPPQSGLILGPARRQVNAEGLLREVHPAGVRWEAWVGAQGVDRLRRSQFFRIFRACAEEAAGLNIFLAATARPG